MGYVQRMLGEHERIVFATHQHWMVLASSFLANFVLAVLVIVATFVVTTMVISPFGLVVGVLLIIPIVRFLYHLLLWQNREYIITNRRVIQIEGVVNKNVIDSSLEKVNDVKLTQSVLGRIMDYGDVEILTASELGANLFRRIGAPIKFKTAMLNQKEALGMGEIPMTPGPAGPDVPSMIENLAQLRKKGLITEEEFQQKKQDLLARI
jgi:uncharacterized membrane protein YdbT with pleckstrin-like domain